jgi:hypothetical protein
VPDRLNRSGRLRIFRARREGGESAAMMLRRTGILSGIFPVRAEIGACSCVAVRAGGRSARRRRRPATWSGGDRKPERLTSRLHAGVKPRLAMTVANGNCVLCEGGGLWPNVRPMAIPSS